MIDLIKYDAVYAFHLVKNKQTGDRDIQARLSHKDQSSLSGQTYLDVVRLSEREYTAVVGVKKIKDAADMKRTLEEYKSIWL